MSAPRRHLVRPPVQPSTAHPKRQQALQKARTRLLEARQALARWMTRLKRAFNAVLKQQRAISRLERKIRTLEEP